MRSYLTFLAAALPGTFAFTYSLTDTFKGTDFLTAWSHEAIADPTHGRVSASSSFSRKFDVDVFVFRNYVDQGTALAQNLTYASGNTLVLRADDWSYLSASGPGRNSVRIRSNTAYGTHVTV